MEERREEQGAEAPATAPGDRTFVRYGPGSVMDHTAMLGTLDTTDTGGPHGAAALKHLAPIFRVAEAFDMAVAARAIDPDDEEISEDHVQVSTGLTVTQGDPEADKRRVLEAAQRAQKRLDGGQEFDPRFAPSYDRQREAEKAWAASVAGMRPTVVEAGVTPVTLSQSPEEAAEAAQEDPPAPVEPPAREPQEKPAPQPSKPPVAPPAPPQQPAQTKREVEEDGGLPGIPRRTGLRRPNKAASKKDWQDWARQCGASDEEIRSSSREQLVEKYASKWPTQK